MGPVAAFLAVVLFACASHAMAADTTEDPMTLGIEAGTGLSRDASDTQLLRLTARFHPTASSEPKEEWANNLALWWEVSLGSWRYEKRGDSRYLLDVGVAPLLRYSFHKKHGVFVEGGVGVHYLNGLYERGNSRFSTRVQFAPHVGVGYRFSADTGEILLRLQHLSNAGIKQPNPGVEFVLLSVGRAF